MPKRSPSWLRELKKELGKPLPKGKPKYSANWLKGYQDIWGVRYPVPGESIYIPSEIEHNASKVERHLRRERRRLIRLGRMRRPKPIVIWRWEPVPGSLRLQRRFYDVI